MASQEQARRAHDAYASALGIIPAPWTRTGCGSRRAWQAVADRIGDREHAADLDAAAVARLRAWLAVPSGSCGCGRVTFSATPGGGVMVRTEP